VIHAFGDSTKGDQALATAQVHFTATAYNLKRSLNLQTA